MKNALPPEQLPEATILLTEIEQQLSNFLELLETEKLAIRQSDFDSLEKNTSEKSEQAKTLEITSEKLSTLLHHPLSDLLENPELIGVESLQQKLDKIRILSVSCHDLNQANGISIQILNNMNDYTLNLITGHDPNTKLYGSKGETQKPKKTGNTLGKA